MKLISKGTPKDAIWAGKCLCCDSKYEANPSELNCESGRNMVADYIGICELCNRRVYFKKPVMRGVQS